MKCARPGFPSRGTVSTRYNEILRLRCAPLRMTETELQAHQIDQKLAPKVNHPAPGIFHVACSGLLENAFVNVMRDLVAQIFLDISLDLLFIEWFDLRGINFVSPQKFAMTLIKLPERSIRPLTIDPERGGEFQAVGQGIIPRCPNRAVLRARRNAQIIKREITLLIQADSGLGTIFFSVEQPEKLPVIFPIPPGIAHVNEPFVFDLAGDFAKRRERV